MERIVLIGAGSAVFTRGLVADLIQTGWQAELALVDTNADALDTAEKLTSKMLEMKASPVKLKASTDRRTVMQNATVVICTIGVGGRRAWEKDVFIPRQFGIFMPVGDTVGPGGTSRALRMIPPMVEIAEDVLDLCPEANFFNYGNPMAAVCRAVRKSTGAEIIGLCHGVPHTLRYLANKLNTASSRMTCLGMGINHLTWLYDFKVNGQDASKSMGRIAAKYIEAANNNAEAVGNPYTSPINDAFSWHLYQLFGGFPAPMDRHVVEFFPQFFRQGNYYGKKLGVDVFSFEDTIADGDSGYAQMESDANAPGPLPDNYFDQFGGEHEQVLDIITSLRQADGKVYYANLPNMGLSPNLPAEAILEMPCAATAAGLTPLNQPALPAGLAGTLATRYQWVETTVESALEKSRRKFIQALVLDGAVDSVMESEALADELLLAHTEYLCGFH